MSKADRRLLENLIVVRERARDLMNDPATPATKAGAILKAFTYRRPPFTRRPRSLNF
jgi:hypothetical protein